MATIDLNRLKEYIKVETTDPKTREYIDFCHMRTLYSYDLYRALELFANGTIDETAFKSRMYDLTRGTRMKNGLRKGVCKVCQNSFWSVTDDKVFCSHRCKRAWQNSIEKAKKKILNSKGGKNGR